MTPPRPRWATTAVAGAAFLAVTTLLAMRTVRLLNVPGDPAMDETRWALCDFRDAVYYPVIAFLDGRNPYGGDFVRTYPVGSALAPYLPLLLVVHLPFGLVSYPAAEVLHFLLTVALTLVLAGLCLELAGLARTSARVLALGALLLLGRPGHWNLVLGQPTLQVALGAYLVLRWADARPLVAAAGLALALVKPSFGLPLTVLMLARGDLGRTVRGLALAATGSALVLAVLARNAGGFAAFATDTRAGFLAWKAAIDPFANSVAYFGAIDAGALVSRLLGRPLAPALELAVTAIVLALGAAAVRRLAVHPTPSARVRVIGIACLTIVVAMHHQAYDWLLLAPTFTALATGAGRLEPPGRPLLRVVLLALLAVPAVNYLASSTALSSLGGSAGLALAICSVNGAALVGALVLAAVATFLEPARADGP